MNLSVWESIAALEDFVRRSAHAAFLRRRREWFERSADAYLVLWWIPVGHEPSVDEAMTRLHHLRVQRPDATAFTFRQRFDRSHAPICRTDHRA